VHALIKSDNGMKTWHLVMQADVKIFISNSTT